MKSLHSSLLKGLLFMLIGTCFGQVVHAQEQVAGNTPAHEISFVGAEGEFLIFELRLHHLPPRGSVLRITNGSGTLYYQERINGSLLNRRYKIFRDNSDKLHFELINGKELLKKSFQVNYRIEEKVEVTNA